MPALLCAAASGNLNELTVLFERARELDVSNEQSMPSAKARTKRWSDPCVPPSRSLDARPRCYLESILGQKHLPLIAASSGEESPSMSSTGETTPTVKRRSSRRMRVATWPLPLDADDSEPSSALAPVRPYAVDRDCLGIFGEKSAHRAPRADHPLAAKGVRLHETAPPSVTPLTSVRYDDGDRLPLGTVARPSFCGMGCLGPSMMLPSVEVTPMVQRRTSRRTRVATWPLREDTCDSEEPSSALAPARPRGDVPRPMREAAERAAPHLTPKVSPCPLNLAMAA